MYFRTEMLLLRESGQGKATQSVAVMFAFGK
jgi:hypothetical protein